jgi:hypothetical protein
MGGELGLDGGQLAAGARGGQQIARPEPAPAHRPPFLRELLGAGWVTLHSPRMPPA